MTNPDPRPAIGGPPTDRRSCVLAIDRLSKTGRPPFASTLGMQGVLAHHLHTPPPRPSATTHDVPTAFDAVIAKGMAKDPNDRYQTVRELAAAACAAVGDSAVSTTGGVAARLRRRIRLSPKAAANQIVAQGRWAARRVLVGRGQWKCQGDCGSALGERRSFP
ncbi:hypothetical protein ACIHDR_37585 [Nocardia sp. NPDC052278]|uniref:hypothetical protein n=1 Tax=unclassified Nocardia TaxID=2637762 RepID=UPI003693BE8D